MTKRTDDKLVLAVTGRVDAQDDYQKCCEAVAEALRKKKLAEAKFIKARAQESRAKEEGATQDQKAQTYQLKRRFEARIKELGCTHDGDDIYPPSGQIFTGDDRHYLTFHREDYTSAHDLYEDALASMEAGVENCTDPDCDSCCESKVTCSLCHAPTPRSTAHRHQGEWICDDKCWDERLRASE